VRDGILLVSDVPVSESSPAAWRLQAYARRLSARGGGLLLCPGPVGLVDLGPGVRQVPVDTPPGLSSDRRAALVSDLLGLVLERNAPRLVHTFGVEVAVPAVLHRPRSGRRAHLVIEPGVLPSQAMRDKDPELAPTRLVDLVALEDKTLSRADALVSSTMTETSTLVRRGLDSERIHLLPRPVVDLGLDEPVPAMPNLVAWVDGEPWTAWRTLLDAVSRLHCPWRLTLLAGPGTPVAAIEQHARWTRSTEKLTIVRDLSLENLAARLQSARAVVCVFDETRSVQAGSVVPEAALLARAARRRVVGPDLPALRAHAGPALYAHEAGADGLARALESILSDPQVAAWSEEAEAFAHAVGLEAFEMRLDALWDSVGGEDG
jgi:hypothetical protein